MSTQAFIGLGANLGDAQTNVERAIERMQRIADSRLIAQSSLFRSAPIDADGDDFINAVVQLATRLSADALLTELQHIEQEFERQRPYPNAPRTLDLDLLLFGNARIDNARLTVPHPRLAQRAFVLIPLIQIDPLISIPGLGAAHLLLPRVATQRLQKI